MNYPDFLTFEHISDKFAMFSLLDLVAFFASMAMVFGGVVPFIPQYLDIRRSKNADGFSTFVCLTLLIANDLRIMFWFGKRFELPLLAQSVVMIITMLALVQVCVQTKSSSEILGSKPRTFSDYREGDLYSRPQSLAHHSTFFDFDMRYFWRWTDFRSYVEFMLLFTLVVGMLTYLLLENSIYVETLGFMAVFAEAMLGAPQFYRNFQNKSTIGMSKKMVMFWTMGDVFKTLYFILREAPPQFWICGMLQVGIDISIFVQVFYYRRLPVLTGKEALS
ncbi:solute carrier family 66 member 2-like isoform X1 [Liolophura sinensis]|uniref:solute carrier family 66 member 2-like isoform X1 n=1 Tax=Liolophura sinensis TaxID=3198878 RepID=UPI0031596921